MKRLILLLLFPVLLHAQDEGATPWQQRVYTNIADLKLRAQTRGANKSCQILGYHEPGDGGGGMLYVTNNFVGTIDDGRVFQSTRDPGMFWVRMDDNGLFNVRKFGARARANVDDSVAFQNAITAATDWGGGRVLIPAGKYPIFKSLTIVNNGVYIFGDGPRSSVIQFGPQIAGQSCFIWTAGSDECFQGGLHDMRIDKTNPLRAQAIELCDISRIVIENVQVGFQGGGWDDGSGSIALWVRGREILDVRNFDFVADRPFVFAKNKNTYVAAAHTIDIDQSWIRNGWAQGNPNGVWPIIEMQNGVNLTRLDIENVGTALGQGGIYWDDNTSEDTSYGLRLRNFSYEQPRGDLANCWTIYISHAGKDPYYAGLQTLDIENPSMGYMANGIYIRNVWRTTIKGLIYGAPNDVTPFRMALDIDKIDRVDMTSSWITPNSRVDFHGMLVSDDHGQRKDTSSPVNDNVVIINPANTRTWRVMEPGIKSTNTWIQGINKDDSWDLQIGGHVGIGISPNANYRLWTQGDSVLNGHVGISTLIDPNYNLKVQGQSLFTGNVFATAQVNDSYGGANYAADGGGNINLSNGAIGGFLDIGAQGPNLWGGYLQARFNNGSQQGLGTLYLNPRDGKLKVGGGAGEPPEQFQINVPGPGTIAIGVNSSSSPLLHWSQAVPGKFPWWDVNGSLTNSPYGPGSFITSSSTITVGSVVPGSPLFQNRTDLGGPMTIDMTQAGTGQSGWLSLGDFNLFNNKVPSTRQINTTAPLKIDNGPSANLSQDRTLSMPVAAAGVDGYLSGTTFNVFNGKVDPSRTLTMTAPLLIDGVASANLSQNRTISMPFAAVGNVDGYLKGTDWATFNAKANKVDETHTRATFSGVTTFNEKVLPGATTTYDLGSSGAKWNILYVGTIQGPYIASPTISSPSINTAATFSSGTTVFFDPGSKVIFKGYTREQVTVIAAADINCDLGNIFTKDVQPADATLAYTFSAKPSGALAQWVTVRLKNSTGAVLTPNFTTAGGAKFTATLSPIATTKFGEYTFLIYGDGEIHGVEQRSF